MWLLIFTLGLVIGSFLNAYIWRLNKGESVWRGRSHCPKCKKPLSWHELIPLVSFIVQLGKCRGCKQKIDWQYPIVELITAVLFVLVFNKIGMGGILSPIPNTQFPIPNFDIWNLVFGNFIGYWILDIGYLLKYWYFFAVLTILFVYDLRYGLVPDRVVIPGIIIAFLFNIISILLSPGFHNWLLVSSYWLLAVAVGAGFFAIQYYGSRGRWVGDGDIRFGALMGAMVGWPQVLLALFASYLIGGFVGAILLLSGQKKFGQTVPMGTFLAIGTLITLLWGKQIIEAYWSL